MTYSFQILFESLWTASIVPFSSEPTFFALKEFGHNMQLPLTLAIVGATAGQMANWLIGRGLLKLQKHGKIHVGPAQYEKSRRLFTKYFLFGLVFCWMPMLNMLSVASGFFGTRLRLVLPLVLLGEAVHYASYLS